MSERRLAYLNAMGIEVWVPRDPVAQAIDAVVPVELAEPTIPVGGNTSQLRADTNLPISDLPLDALRTQVAQCTACELHASRTQTVFGVGNPQAEWMIVGEAPGADEDRQGEPFVGRAGQLLNAMLKAVGLERGDVYIANILKCRPPGNRDPQPEEAAQCTPFLNRQIELIQPRLILAVGRVAAHHLLQTDVSLAKLRGSVHRYDATGSPVVVSYHPAYLLRSPKEKRKAWEDLQFARQAIRKYQ